MSELTRGFFISSHIRAALSREKEKASNLNDVVGNIRISQRTTIASSYPSVGAWSNSAIVRLSAIVSLGVSTRFGGTYWNNPEGTPYPHNLSKPLPLIPNARGRLVIPFDHFINNDLEYLKGGSSSRKYTTSITKTKAADYGQVKWIEDRIPRTTWSVVPIDYDKHAYWGTYHWGPKRQRFYGYATNMETSKDVYSRHRIIAVISLKIMKFFGYSHLEEITVRRQDDVLYKFREGDFKRLRRQDIEDMLLLLVQGKLTNLSLDDRYALNVALRMYTRRIVIQERVEDLQLAVESYQKKINLTRPDTTRPDLRKMTPYTGYPDVQGIIYQDELNRNRLMRTDELHKFSDATLNHVRTTLNDIATGIQMDYLPKRRWSPQDKRRARVMISAIDKKLRDRRLMRSLEKFVGGRPFYTSAGNPVKEILLKLNLLDHRSILTDSKMVVKVGDEVVYKELGDRMERAATTASSLEAKQDSGSGPRCQDTILRDVDAQTRFETTSKQSNDPPILRGYTLGSGEDNMKLLELMELCTKLINMLHKNRKSDLVSQKK
ncbi:hypothetical protein Tco_1577006 [Tanacetum coccineum]